GGRRAASSWISRNSACAVRVERARLALAARCGLSREVEGQRGMADSHNQPEIDRSGRPLRGARVLVVEDDAIVLMELEAILQDAGAETVACCRNVKDGLTAVEEKPLAAAILDVNIGQRTIAPVARRLTHYGTPFLFYTGEVQNESTLSEWPGHAGRTKPERPAAIIAAVAHLLGYARAAQT